MAGQAAIALARGVLREAAVGALRGTAAGTAAGAVRFAAEAAIGGAAILGARALAELPGRTARAKEFQDILTFPSDLDLKYCMSIRFVKYEKRAISNRKDIITQGSIYLPIPNQLNDTTSLSYNNQAELGSMIGSFSEALTGTQNRGGTIAEGGLVEGMQRALGAAPGGEKILNAVSAVSGLAINPFLTVVFKSPTFKTHSFSWKFMPKNQAESDSLTRIVQTIKYHMLPGLLTSSGVIFEYPEMVLLKIYPTEKHLYNFKPCIIKSMNVNFAPSGGPSFFRSVPGAPTGIEVKIELQEIEYFTKLDFIDLKDYNTGLPDIPVTLQQFFSIFPGIPGIIGQIGQALQ